MRMVITVDGTPPGGHGVNQLGAVLQLKPNALGRGDLKHGNAFDHGRIRMPQVISIKRRDIESVVQLSELLIVSGLIGHIH